MLCTSHYLSFATYDRRVQAPYFAQKGKKSASFFNPHRYIGKAPFLPEKQQKPLKNLPFFRGFAVDSISIHKTMVEATGLEPTTSWSLTKRATKLRYASICRSPENPLFGRA